MWIWVSLLLNVGKLAKKKHTHAFFFFFLTQWLNKLMLILGMESTRIC